MFAAGKKIAAMFRQHEHLFMNSFDLFESRLMARHIAHAERAGGGGYEQGLAQTRFRVDRAMQALRLAERGERRRKVYQALVGSEPNSMLPIFVDGGDPVAGQAFLLANETLETALPVEQHQAAVLGTHCNVAI